MFEMYKSVQREITCFLKDFDDLLFIFFMLLSVGE